MSIPPVASRVCVEGERFWCDIALSAGRNDGFVRGFEDLVEGLINEDDLINVGIVKLMVETVRLSVIISVRMYMRGKGWGVKGYLFWPPCEMSVSPLS